MTGYYGDTSYLMEDGNAVRSYACSVDGYTTEETISAIEQIFQQGKVVSLEYFNGKIYTMYLDDGSLFVPDSFSELLDYIPIEDAPAEGSSFLEWLMVCSDILKIQNIFPSTLLCRDSSYILEALGLEKFRIIDDTILNYNVIVDKSFDDHAIFLLGTLSSRAEPLRAVMAMRYEIL